MAVNNITGMEEATPWISFIHQLDADSAKLSAFVSGLQLSTLGVTLGSNVATFLTTPSSANLRAALSDESGTGALLFAGSALGDATVTTINKYTLTAPASGATLVIADGKTFTVSKTLTLDGTDSTTMTFPSTSATIARTDAANTFTGTQTVGALVATTVNGNTITTGTGVLTLGAGKTVTFNHTSTFTTTDAQTYTFPTTSATLARIDAANTFTGASTTTSWVETTPVITGGLTASGSGANTFAGSTGTFITSSGANTLSGAVSVADATTPSVTLATGKTNSGFFSALGKTSGGIKILPADASGSLITITNTAQTVGTTTLTIPDFANVSDTFAFVTLAQTLSNKTFVAPVLGVATGTSLAVSGLLTSSSATAGIGYATGAGGTVTQGTNRTTGVTLSKVCGQITTHTASLAAGAAATFTVTNTTVATTDVIRLCIASGSTTVQTMAYVSGVGSGTFNITINNGHASTAEVGAIVMNFTVLKAVAA